MLRCRLLNPMLVAAFMAVSGWLASSALAADRIDFEQQIRPILRDRCVSCHGPEKQKSGLRLDAKTFAFEGGSSGPAIVPGNAEQSDLWRRISSRDPDERMPPEGDALPPAEMARLKQWIDEGAVWPETAYDRDATRDPRLKHWAWQPIESPTVPATSDDTANRVGNEIDRFILSRLAESGLEFSPEADRRTLIRRLCFDLHGLPPTPEDVEAFANDPAPDAYEKLVDRLLNSPRYGERWARHWLDVAHYADTHGFERDQRRDHAWRYRDWVVKALNSDIPYDAFVRLQIAGDAIAPRDPDAIIATAFLAAGPWDFVGQAETPSPVLKRLARADDLDDMVTQVMTSTCAVTIHCARCHDHKLDPISQREYYSLCAVFAGSKRGNRTVSADEERQLNQRRAELERRVTELRRQITRLRGTGWSLSDIVGGGDGTGSGKAGAGIDPVTGKPITDKRGFLEGAAANRFSKATIALVDGVVIPNGGNSGEVPISSSGLVARGVPRTSGQAWDAIRNGPVNSQFSTTLGGTDFANGEHELLAIHANAAITFDLPACRTSFGRDNLRLHAHGGYFGQTPRDGASLHIFLDGVAVFERRNLGRDDGLIEIDLTIPVDTRFLTLMATDGGNDIGHDQICLADARFEPASLAANSPDTAAIEGYTRELEKVKQELAAHPEPAKVYGILSETPPPVQVLARGNPEQPKEAVTPGALACLANVPFPSSGGDLDDAQRRLALATWITDPRNPLIRRTIVNRLWHHHFGVALVDTPSDFGVGGSSPSHPQLLDWLSDRLIQDGWSLKSIHRLICGSATYRQASVRSTEVGAAVSRDASNRLLWRQNPRRLDAESMRDSVLAVSGVLNRKMYGPGFRDFDYKEEYAPVYTYTSRDQPELWRRSIYRFVVRTTPHPFLTTLDCPNPANMTPARSVTTTALQSLALLHSEFMLQQAKHFAARLQEDSGDDPGRQIVRAFQLAFARQPTDLEMRGAIRLVKAHGLKELCRILLNGNEFAYVD